MRNDISIRSHHVHIILHHANKLLKCLWMMITAFSFSPIKQFCGETFISLPKTRFGDQSLSFKDISLFVLHAVWPLVKGLKGQHCWKTHFTHLKSSVLLL